MPSEAPLPQARHRWWQCFPNHPRHPSAPQNTQGMPGATATAPRPPGGLCPQTSAAPGLGGLTTPSAQEGSLPKPGHPHVLHGPPAPYAARLFPNPEGLPGAGADAGASGAAAQREAGAPMNGADGVLLLGTAAPRCPAASLVGTPLCAGRARDRFGGTEGVCALFPPQQLRLCRATSQPGTAAGGPACAKGDTWWGQGAGPNWGQVQSSGGKSTRAQSSGSGREGPRIVPAGTGLTSPLCHHAAG